MTTKYIRASNTSLFLLVIQLASLLSLAQAKDRPSLRGLVDVRMIFYFPSNVLDVMSVHSHTNLFCCHDSALHDLVIIHIL